MSLKAGALKLFWLVTQNLSEKFLDPQEILRNVLIPKSLMFGLFAVFHTNFYFFSNLVTLFEHLATLKSVWTPSVRTAAFMWHLENQKWLVHRRRTLYQPTPSNVGLISETGRGPCPSSSWAIQIIRDTLMGGGRWTTCYTYFFNAKIFVWQPDKGSKGPFLMVHLRIQT